MLGAIVGDFIGSSWEGCQPSEFSGDLIRHDSQFTDDTVLTITTGYALALGLDFAAKYRESILDYHHLGFSEPVLQWADGRQEQQYFNFGNGAAIRVSPVSRFATDLESALQMARESAAATHFDPFPIKLAELVGGATYLAHHDSSPKDILQFAIRRLPSVFSRPRSGEPYQWESVVTAIEIACQTRSFESCMRECIAAGGDVDSVCAMAGGISEPLWGCPSSILTAVLERLEVLHPDLFRMLRLAMIGKAGLPEFDRVSGG